MTSQPSSIEHQRHAMTVMVQARDAYELRRDRITLVAVAALIAALLVLGAALAETSHEPLTTR